MIPFLQKKQYQNSCVHDNAESGEVAHKHNHKPGGESLDQQLFINTIQVMHSRIKCVLET